jgi:N-succinyl-L-ornithine transcarbamylase
MKNFISVHDVADVEALAQEAIAIKNNPNQYKHLGDGKTMVLLFLNPSLRTRLSTQKAAYNLGMHTIVMNVGMEGWKLEFEDGAIMSGDSAEHIKEAAAVVSQYADIIGIRSFAELKDKEYDYSEFIFSQFVKYVSVPMVNLESATLHPFQSLTDLITIREFKIQRPKVVLTWAPHPRALPQAVANSFSQWMVKADVDFVITNPPEYDLSKEFTGNATVLHDQEEAFEGADFIYAKNWSSYEYYGRIIWDNLDWTVNAEKMRLTINAKFMHCLPVRRNIIVTDEVLDSSNSIVIQQAGNRVWAAQVILKKILEEID